MGFHKGKFRIARIDNTIEFVEGWIDETNTYGFHRIEKIGERCGKPRPWKWIATDIASGLRICEGLTRKACGEWIDTNAEKIANTKNSDKYKTWVKNFVV